MIIVVKQQILEYNFEHRIIYDNEFYGTENLYSSINDPQKWEHFLFLLKILPTGTFETLTWERQ